MKKQFIQCGKIVSTHGIKGEMKALVWGNDPYFLLEFKTFYFDNGKTPLEIKSSRIHKKMLLLTVDGIDSIDKANNYRGQVLYINREDDPTDALFLDDFLGIRVYDIDSGQDYGEIAEVIVTGANDVFVLKDSANKQRLIPDIPQVILETDLEEKIMKIRPLKGLFDDEN